MGTHRVHQSNVSSLLVSYGNTKESFSKRIPEIKIAFLESEKRKAYELAYDEYLKKGYINVNDAKLLKDENDLDEENVIIFNAFMENELAGTITVNTKTQLPFEKTWPLKLLTRDLQCKKAAEITRFAVDAKYKNNGDLLKYLFVTSFLYAKNYKSCQGLFIEVTPSHSKFYQHYICFDEIGRSNRCHRVKNTKAALLWLDFEKCKSKLSKSKVNLNEAEKNRLNMDIKYQFARKEADNLYIIF